MKLTKTKYIIVGILLTMCISIYARDINVNGRVVGKYDGEPMIGASVKAMFADRTDSLVTIADVNGKFTAIVHENQLLRFQFIGYKDTIAFAKENMLVEMEDGGEWENPLWIVDDSIADVDYPDIWYSHPSAMFHWNHWFVRLCLCFRNTILRKLTLLIQLSA